MRGAGGRIINRSIVATAFAASGFFAFRTPLLPFDELLTWGEGLESPAAINDRTHLEAALAADRVRLRERLRIAIQRPEVREALFIASPDLDARIAVWLRDPDSDAGRKVERSLVRYFQRMAGRATPFGLFAGCSVGTIGHETRLETVGRDGYQRHTRLDMEYLVSLAQAPVVRESLRYRPNSTLYRTGGRLRYVEYRGTGKERTYRVVGIEDSEPLRLVLDRAVSGATPAELAAGLLDSNPDATLAEGEEFVRELIEAQVLVSDLTPPVTGSEPIHELSARLRRDGAPEVARRLEQAAVALGAIDDQGVGVASERYRAVAELLSELPAKVEPGRLFQVDMTKPTLGASLGAAVASEIRRGAELLGSLSIAPAEDDLSRFRKAFVERYQGEDTSEQNARWVPLLEALDEEIGIGSGTSDGRGAQSASLLEDFSFAPSSSATVPWGKREHFLLRKLGEALSRGDAEIVLGSRDLEALANPEPLPLPDAFAVMATLAATSPAAVARGDYRIVLEYASGPSGAAILGRFCHADPNLHLHVKEHLRAEELLDPNAIFAEVAHLPPDDRVGNILLRPVLRDYEIVYAANSGAPDDRQIPVTDLQVAVIANRVVLRSARLGKRVIPRLTSAHNFTGRGHGVYRFLCQLQTQGTARASWDWGPFRTAPYLPRVVTGRFVLACARWMLSKEELKGLGAASPTERFRLMQDGRAERRWPRWLLLSDGDNNMPLDLDNALSVETFVEMVKGREQATLVEMLPGPDELCATNLDGRFAHELVVPFVRTPATQVREQRDNRRAAFTGGVRRSFPPGSEWLYAKLYCGPALADQVLLDVVRPVVARSTSTGAADGWFFIRYSDPEWHLRLRFHSDPERLREEVWPLLDAAVAPHVADGRVWRIQLDTYEREVERYGGAVGIELAERLFQLDSEIVLRLADLLAQDASGELRWRVAFAGMNLLLDAFGFDLAEKHAVARRTRDAFAKEFRVGTEQRKRLGEKYRTLRTELEHLLEGSGTGASGTALAVLSKHSPLLAETAAELRAAASSGRLSHALSDLVPSFLHMHANRMLRSGQRAQETILYDFLDRSYRSQCAKHPVE